MVKPPITATQCFGQKTEEEEEEVEKIYKGYRELIIPTLPRIKGLASGQLYLYQGFWISARFIQGAMYFQEHFKSRPTDILLATTPKCGTTWLKALIFSIMNREIYTDMEEHPLLTIGVHECVPFLEPHLFEELPIGDPEILPSPRLLATHVPYTMLPESAKSPNGCRIVYVWRDPKDAFVSLWHFACAWSKKIQLPDLPSLGEVFDSFSHGMSPYGPFWDQVVGYWKASVEYPNKILIVKYEDMKRDPISQVKKLAEFLGQPFTAEEEERGAVNEIVKLCSFDTMSRVEAPYKGNFYHEGHPDYQDFFRRCEVGDSKNLLTADMIQQLDEITREKFKGTGLVI